MIVNLVAWDPAPVKVRAAEQFFVESWNLAAARDWWGSGGGAETRARIDDFCLGQQFVKLEAISRDTVCCYQGGLRIARRLQMTRRFDPLVIATYRLRALRLLASSITAASASKPFRVRVLPTDRPPIFRPVARPCSRTRTAASGKETCSGPHEISHSDCLTPKIVLRFYSRSGGLERVIEAEARSWISAPEYTQSY